jgi:hypothetical protein
VLPEADERLLTATKWEVPDTDGRGPESVGGVVVHHARPEVDHIDDDRDDGLEPHAEVTISHE